MAFKLLLLSSQTLNMKYAVLFCFACLTIFSCKKKDNYIDVPVHDTTIVILHDTVAGSAPTIVGKWNNITVPGSNLTFTADSYNWYGQWFKYLLSSDTVYTYNPIASEGVHNTGSTFGYKLAKSNDSLWIYFKSTPAPNDIQVYLRVN